MTQPETLRVADAIELNVAMKADRLFAAAELRRLHELNQELVEALESIENMYSSDQTVGDACLALYEARNTAQAALAKARGTE
jgi:hypothetical protein